MRFEFIRAKEFHLFVKPQTGGGAHVGLLFLAANYELRASESERSFLLISCIWRLSRLINAIPPALRVRG